MSFFYFLDLNKLDEFCDSTKKDTQKEVSNDYQLES